MQDPGSRAYHPDMNPIFLLLSIAACSAGLLVSCSLSRHPGRANGQFFTSEVKPVLEQNCLLCHNTGAHPSGLNLSGPGAVTAVKGGRRYIVPGRPDESLLIAAVSRGGSHPKTMPRLDMSLTEDQIAVLTQIHRAGQLHARLIID